MGSVGLFLINPVPVVGAVVVVVAAGVLLFRLRRRRRHRRDVADRVFLPLRERLESDYMPLSVTRAPLIRLVETPQGPMLEPALPEPGPAASGPLAADARAHHVPELFAELDNIQSQLATIAGDLSEWVRGLAGQLLAASGLPPVAAATSSSSSTRPEESSAPFVDHLRLAHYLYLRINGLTRNELRRKQKDNAGWLLADDVQTYAAAPSPEAVDALLHVIRGMLFSKIPESTRFRERLTKVSVAVDRLAYHLQQMVLAPRLPGRCGLE
jgi:hypothetical protein